MSTLQQGCVKSFPDNNRITQPKGTRNPYRSIDSRV